VNDVSSALRTAAVNRAARVLEGQKLQVLDRNRASGEHHLDLVTTPGSDILAAAGVRIVTRDSLAACMAALTEARFRQAADAARERQRQREGLFHDLRGILAAVDPASGTEVVTGNAPTGVA